MQQYADIYLLLNYSTYFGRQSRPSSGVHKTVIAACGTDHTIWGASFFKRDHVVTFEEACSRGHVVTFEEACLRDHVVAFEEACSRGHVVTFEEACSPDSMICTRGCKYSFIYS